MAISDIKYFSFIDPITGGTTKDVGYTQSREVTKVLSKKLGDNPVVIESQQTVTRTVIVAPPEEDLSELSKEDFYALDTTGESETVKIRRIKKLLLLEKEGFGDVNQKKNLLNKVTLQVN